jgi:hypothetical protein
MFERLKMISVIFLCLGRQPAGDGRFALVLRFIISNVSVPRRPA